MTLATAHPPSTDGDPPVESAPSPPRRRRESSARSYSPAFSWALLLPTVALLLIFFYYPLLVLVKRSLFDPGFTVEHYRDVVRDPLTMLVLGRTMRTGAIATGITLVLGYPVALLMSRAGRTGATLLAAMVVLPLWTSVLVRSYAWKVLLADGGLVNDALMSVGIIDRPLKLLYTELSVWIGMTHILLPIMILPIYATLHGVPRDLGQAASSLGASNFHVFRLVTLPLSLPGVAAGTMLVFISSLGFFITQRLLGGPTNLMLATLISQRATVLLDWPAAAALSMVLLAVTLVVIAVFMRFLRLERILGAGGD